MYDNEQEETPFLDALKAYADSDPACFDVPSHRGGKRKTDLDIKLSPELTRFDWNAPIGLDNLYNAHGVLEAAEKLAAKACHADHCFFSVNGSTGGILTAMIGCLDTKDEIILPRNVHKSVINGLIVSGAIPIFISPDIDEKRGIAKGVRSQVYIEAMDAHPKATAVFVINPTYFGVSSDIKTIVEEAHKRNMIVIADEAHGSNFYFSSKLPCSAMDAGADISVLSMHKNSLSLTQSSMVLTKGNGISYSDVKKAFGMFSSTSPNHLLLASLDAARKEMALHGEEDIDDALELAEYARTSLNQIPGIHVYGKEYVTEANNDSTFAVDPLKLVIDVTGLNMYGYEVYREIRRESNIQLELGEVSVVLAIVSVGNDRRDIDRLIAGFKRLSSEHYSPNQIAEIPQFRCPYPKTLVPPREAYDAPHKIVGIIDSIGEVSAETVMAYPPGIPIVIPGEIISKDVVALINFYEKEGGQVLKDSDHGKMKVIDRASWYLAEDFPFWSK